MYRVIRNAIINLNHIHVIGILITREYLIANIWYQLPTDVFDKESV